MKKIAFLGASSQIAKDLICSMAQQQQADLLLYVRDLKSVESWLQQLGLTRQCKLYLYDDYGKEPHDTVINFVGVGNPQRASQMGGDIFAITQKFDDLVLADLRHHPGRRYIFLSSGAAYGSGFLEPAGPDTKTNIVINNLLPQDYYAIAKLHAEAKHRALNNFAITDIRVFNYFSRTQDLSTRFFITDIVRAIRDGVILHTSPDYMVRDFLHPSDFHQLINCILAAPAKNSVIDCYTREPVDKMTILKTMHENFGLEYKIVGAAAVNATGTKPHYYSLNHKAEEIGYRPTYSSQEGILIESNAILGRKVIQTQAPLEDNNDSNQ